jgi:hypothetical protein
MAKLRFTGLMSHGDENSITLSDFYRPALIAIKLPTRVSAKLPLVIACSMQCET